MREIMDPGSMAGIVAPRAEALPLFVTVRQEQTRAAHECHWRAGSIGRVLSMQANETHQVVSEGFMPKTSAFPEYLPDRGAPRERTGRRDATLARRRASRTRAALRLRAGARLRSCQGAAGGRAVRATVRVR